MYETTDSSGDSLKVPFILNETTDSSVDSLKVPYVLHETTDISVDSLKVPHIFHETLDSFVEHHKASQFFIIPSIVSLSTNWSICLLQNHVWFCTLLQAFYLF